MPQAVNSITGQKRRLPRDALPRKKRSSHSSTTAGRMYSEQALDSSDLFITGTYQQMAFFVALASIEQPQVTALSTMCFLTAAFLFTKAVRMLRLDSDIMDISSQEIEESGYRKPLVDVTIDSYENDDECEDKTRFTKNELHLILEDFDDLSDTVKLYYYGSNYYKFKVETLLLYVLRKFATGRTHKDMTEEFGGCATRWGRGYRWFVMYLDDRYASLIGPQGLSVWVDQFPYFAEQIRDFIVRPKKRIRSDGTEEILDMPNHYIEPGNFNIMGLIDCTHYEICRPGSGPDNSNEGSPRRAGWYIKQRAWYSSYQRGMEACCKILTVCLPNGMTGCVYGPTSGRRNDLSLFRYCDLDYFMLDLCLEHHAGDLYAVYGDGIFAGYWHCLRTKHVAPPGMELTDEQKEENENMAAARISVEWSYARAEQLWPMLLDKSNYKVDMDPAKVFAEIRVMYLLTNFKVCCSEGSTMTGQRMFRCPPPTLQWYLNERVDINNN